MLMKDGNTMPMHGVCNLLGLSIPSEVAEVRVVAVCSQTGESKKSYTLKLR